jgi:uncharacterized protein
MNDQAKKLCIYHGNCLDGFGAAWAVYHAAGNDFEFHKGIHQQLPPDVEGRDVYLVDFSYRRDVLEKMAETASSITIIDHHISAEKDLSDLLENDVIKGIFNMNKSGAMLTWEWFHPDVPAPKLIEHIQDRDLWQFKLDGTNQILAGLSSYPFSFSEWDLFMANNNKELETLHQNGQAIDRKLQKDVRDLISDGVRRMMIGGYDVPVLNASSIFVSDAGNILSEGEPFAACYWDHANGRSFSLRSKKNGADVSEVAKQYGGGGHVNAAGFTMDIGWEGESQ